MDDASNYEFKSRKQRLHLISSTGATPIIWAAAACIVVKRSRKIGYLTNLNLHGYEEAELGIRLQAAGYKLHRPAAPYFSHASYTMPTFKNAGLPLEERLSVGAGRVAPKTAGVKPISRRRCGLYVMSCSSPSIFWSY